jgi:hypothetical protein
VRHHCAGLLRQKANTANSFCIYLSTVRFEFLISVLTQVNDLNFERTRLDKNETENLTANQGQLRKTVTKQTRKRSA